ncbi:hypothetical protein [Bradyrhizobium sp. AS23.2]|uniref:hypothetical protein n=1 Tax=Bradyrhizobium sp. AS23.2 TaxID=1680155 RepID=UPI00142FC3D2|nr:hypothetical protein [Bradyrhizobium sp. AS23.2]
MTFENSPSKLAAADQPFNQRGQHRVMASALHLTADRTAITKFDGKFTRTA